MNYNAFTSGSEFKTDRLLLRPLLSTDADFILQIRSNKEVNRYIDRKPAENIDDAHAFIKMVEDKAVQKEAFYRIICIENETAGTICLFNADSEKNQVEIGYELLPAFQGKGIMLEAVSFIRDYCFNEMKVDTLLAVIHPENTRSGKLLENIGFNKSAEQPAGEKSNGVLFVLKKGE